MLNLHRAENTSVIPDKRRRQTMGASSPIEAAQSIGKYTLIEKLGEGYLGPVYRGFDQDSGGPVVVRILCDGIKWDTRLEEAFDLECRAVAELQHPNIARIF